MTIQVNSDRSVKVSASFVRLVKEEVGRVLERFADVVTRVEVHLSDVNSRKAGANDKRCLVEARPAAAPPVIVTASAATIDAALAAALGKMRRLLTTTLGRLGRSARRTSPAATSATATGAAAPSTTAAKRAASPRTPTAKADEAKPASSRGPKKKRIFQARRKAWPSR